MSQTPPASQLAYVLHSRAYRENSALVDFLTPQGRLRAVLRSARGKAGSLARPFVPLDVEFRGRGELKNVGRMESAGIAAWLEGEALFSGLYLNELLIRLLPAEDPHPGVFDHYAATLAALAEKRALEPLLRSFEWRLLDDLGYGFALDADINGEALAADGMYRLQVDAGLERVYLLQRLVSGRRIAGDVRSRLERPWCVVSGQASDASGAGGAPGWPPAGEPRIVS